MRVGYLSGPVDAAEVIAKWKSGDALDYFGTSYLSEMLGVVTDLVVVTYYQGKPDGRETVHGIPIYNIRPVARSGIRFYLRQCRDMLQSIGYLLRERVDVVVATALDTSFFMLTVLKLAGIRVVPVLHCTLWPPLAPLNPGRKLFRWINRNLFWRWHNGPTLAASSAIASQVLGASVFLPTYQPFAVPAPPEGVPFVILSAGRIEVNKGVFDLVEAVRGLDGVELHFAGEGAAIGQLRAVAQGLPITVHGFCGRDKLMELFARCHAVVVPTRIEFEEGFAMICAEGVMAGRPVITSRVCPALEYIAQGAVEVRPNDVAGYREAIRRLAEDRTFYEEKRAGAVETARQFFDPANGYAAKLRTALAL